MHQINEEIRDSEIRLISATGEQLGIMSAAQAQHIAQPVAGYDPGRQPVALRIERLQHEVAEHPALTGQPPARFAPCRIERLREGVVHLALQAMHQAGVATAGAAAMGHGDAAGEQRIQQVAAGGDGKASLADPYVRHW